MADIPELEDQLHAFHQHFESIRVELGITDLPNSAEAVLSAAPITDGKSLVVELILALQDQREPRYWNDLANLFQIASRVLTDSFDIKLAIPLIQQVVNNESDESIYNAVSSLADRLIASSLINSRGSTPDTQTSASSNATVSNSSKGNDEPEFRPTKRAKLAHDDFRDDGSQNGGGRCEAHHQEEVEALNHAELHAQTAIEKSSIFQYRPLDTTRREIRLLLLPPGNTFSYSCSLIHVSMDDDPEYEALSYVWGSEANQKVISINGGHKSVTRNLAEALSHLSISDYSRKLWVDAVCINQKDISEKSHQIGNMNDIYAGAKRVVAWIGVLGTATQHLLHRLDNSEDDRKLSSRLSRWTASGSRIVADPSFPLTEDEKRLLSELAQLPWFRRVWVIQEVAVAREVIVQTGHTTISWSNFGAALEKCISNDEMKSIIEAMGMINAIRTARSHEPYHMDLIALLEQFRHRIATDERDKVYALLGLTSSSLAQEAVIQVDPDYSKPAADIYMSLTRQYINRRRNLDIICHATLSNHVPTPSWVPDWSYYNRGLSILPKRRTAGSLQEPMYRCCGGLKLDRELLFGIPQSKNKLWVNGFKFDVVSIVGKMATKVRDLGLQQPIDRVSDLLKDWESMSESCSHVYGSTLKDSSRRTLHADAIGTKRYYHPVNPAFRTADATGSQFDSTIEGSSSVFVSIIDGSFAHIETVREAPVENSVNSRVDVFEESMKRAVVKRTFFITEKGYMGLGPFNIEQGDLVYVLAGGQVPFILRPNLLAEGFCLVGEGYVHGIMDGEATGLGIEIETIFLE